MRARGERTQKFHFRGCPARTLDGGLKQEPTRYVCGQLEGSSVLSCKRGLPPFSKQPMPGRPLMSGLPVWKAWVVLLP